MYTSFCAAGGAGAVAGYDGYQCTCDMGTLGVVGKTDAEEEMARFPWDVNRYEFRTDAHGAGKWRGSPGITWEAVNESGDCNFIGGPWSGFTTEAKGQNGGQNAPLNKAHVLRGDDRLDIIEPHRPLKLKHGDLELKAKFGEQHSEPFNVRVFPGTYTKWSSTPRPSR